MVDLKSQYDKIKPEIDTAIQEVIDSTAFIGGPAVKEFQADLEKYLQVNHVIPCGNGTDALQIALMALDLKPGDEVITPSFTFIATTEVIALLGLTPVFVDVHPDTFCMDVEKLKAAISPKTKVIIPVHLYGQTADMDPIMEVANAHDLIVIEDTAQAIGSEYTHRNGQVSKTGTIGHIGTTSFFPSKNLGCYGDGGAIFTKDENLANTMRKIANHGASVRYHHEIVGCNSRLDTIQAAILKVKLKSLDAYCEARKKAAAKYNAAFANEKLITTPFESPNSKHVFHQYTLKLEGVDRDALIQHLASKGIPSMIYYPIPGHKQKMFSKFDTGKHDLSVTDYLTPRVISLPIHTELEDEQIDYITREVLHFIQDNKK